LVQGDTVKCTVTPFDGTDLGTPMHDTLTISNTVPVLTDVTLVPDPAYEDDTLTCTAGSAMDVDGSAITLDYAWTVNGGAIAATSETLTGADFNKNDDVSCTVTPNDGTDDGAAVTSNTVIISNSAPSISGVTIDPATATASDALTCSWTGFSDADGDSDASTINWTINGVDSGTSTVLMSGFVGGDTVTCTVTAFDGTDDGTVLSDTIVIDNTAPVLADVSLEPVPAYEDTTLTCTPGSATDSDGAAITFNYAWIVNSVGIAATSTTLTGADFDKNDDVFCTVTPTDGSDSGAAIDSGTVTIQNTAPEAPFISIIPAAPIAGEDDLVCSVDADSYDLDSDSITYSFEWSVDGVFYGTDDTISGAETNDGETWTCTVTPDDGDEVGAIITVAVTVGTPSCRALSWESDQYTTADIMSYGGAWTMEGWYRVNSLPSSPIDGGLLSLPANDLLCTSSGQYWWINTWSDGQVTAGLESVGDVYSDTSLGTSIALGEWMHLALQYHGGGEGSFYVDGTLVTSFSGVTAGWNDDCPLYIGTHEGLSSHPSHADLSSLHYTMQQKYDGSFTPDRVLSADVDTLWLFDFAEADAADPSVISSLVGDASIDIGDLSLIDISPDQCSNDWADYTSPSTDYGMNYIPPGTFEMGCTEDIDLAVGCNDDERPVHEVTVTNGYYIGVTEVTQTQWAAVMGVNPSTFSCTDCPVEQISWIDAVEFANQLSAMDGFTPAYTTVGTDIVWDESADGYRLATDSEWEHAARGEDETVFAGSDVATDVAWYDANAGGTTHTVASLSPNGFDLFDMSGNVYEWVWADDVTFPSDPVIDPWESILSTTVDKVSRGGDWVNGAKESSVSDRTWDPADHASDAIGLRLARTVHTDADEDGVIAALDCDDSDPSIHPYAGDTYGDGIDSDCDGLDCESGYSGDTYFVVCETDINQPTSENTCIEAGYEGLASILSEVEQGYIESMMTLAGYTHNSFWIGLTDIAVEGEWVWSDGSPLSYVNWHPTEPDPAEEDCAAISWAAYDSMWFDAVCDDVREGGFVCSTR
jgi:formylglycine-generating enzyme required for sulfatase activity